MNAKYLPASLIAGVLAAVSSLAGAADWALATNPAVVRPAPSDLQVQAQNPPGFSWARHPSNPASYTFELTGPNSVGGTVVTRNWYLPTKALGNGTYSWRVRPTNDPNGWSTPRSFIISPASQVFEVPAEATLRATILAHGRSRELPVNFPLAKNWSADEAKLRNPALAALKNDVAWRVGAMTLLSDSEWITYPVGDVSAPNMAQSVVMGQRISTAEHQIEAAALLYRLTLDPQYLKEAVRRGDNLASLNLSGATSYAHQDQVSRQVALALMNTADMLWNEINQTDATRRARWLANITKRTNDMYADLSGSDGRLDQFPFDSHGGSNLGYLTLISTLAVGDIPDADAWFNFSFRSYANAIYAWAGPEGGFANGSAYAEYTANIALMLWQPLSQASGVNFFNKPWAGGFMRYLATFIPPGAPTNVFGDQHEVPPSPALMSAFASRFPLPMAAWYVQNLNVAEDPLTLLQASYPLPIASVTAAPPPLGTSFPSIGWAAMHSELKDSLGTSVYFKSSPYGSYNHSHGDQNALVLVSGPRPLLTEAGYSDYYGSTMANTWYRQTRSHNAITYDGGVGQVVDANDNNLLYVGNLNKFQSTAAQDFAEGDAHRAYGATPALTLTTALRQVFYLRNQDAVLVRDVLAAPTAHKFEWNFHAAAAIALDTNPKAKGTGGYIITNVDRSVCVRPVVPGSVTYETRISPYAARAGTVEAHAAFTQPSTKSAEFLMVLDVGCKYPAVSISTVSGSRQVTVGSQTVTIPN